MKTLISVCGSDGDDTSLSYHALETAELVGQQIAKHGAVLTCGGRGGVMKAACKGAKEAGGTTVGILPDCKEEGNEFVDIPITTCLGDMRNFLVVNTADVVIAIGGRWGTLNEISFAMSLKKPLVLVAGTGGCVDEIVSGKIMQNTQSTYMVAHSAQEAVEKAFSLIKK